MENDQIVVNSFPHIKNFIHIQYCTNCHSHNWNTHHNQAKYHETFIKLKNLIQSHFKTNPPVIIANQLPNYLLPIKQHQNKYYNQLTKKYVFFPNIGSFQIFFNGQLIFSKKKTNNWPSFQSIINDLSIKINHQPFQSKIIPLKKTQTNQTQTQFSSDQKIIPQAFKTLYKHQNKNYQKNFGKFTLTDHFKSFHVQNNKKPRQTNGYCFDSSTTIKQSPENVHKNNNHVQDIDGLRKALLNKTQENDSFVERQQPKKGNEKQILINLCSIEEQGANTKQIPELRAGASSSFKKTSAIINSYPLQMTSAYNGSEKSLSLQRFKEINNDIKKIEKHFQHIEKKMIINDENQKQQDLNDEGQQSRINDNENLGRESQTRFLKNKAESKQNYFNYIQRYSKQNKLLAYLANMEAPNIKVTDKYDDRYLSPTHYQENQLCKNVPSKKFSQIQKYLKSNNEEKNKKLKKIYGDWKVSSNHLNYMYYLDNGKKALLRDSTNTNNQSKQRYRTKNGQEDESDTSPQEVTSQSSQSHRNKFATTKNSENRKNRQPEEPQIKKHSSFIIKHKSQHKNASNSNSKSKLNKNINQEKSGIQFEPKFFPSKSGPKYHHQSHQNAQFQNSFTKKNSKSFQVSANKSRVKEKAYVQWENDHSRENEPNLVEQIQKIKNNRQINQINEVSQPNSIKSGSSISKSPSYISVSNSYLNDPTNKKIPKSFNQIITEQQFGSEELQQIEEIKQVEFTQQSQNVPPTNRVTIEFHEFEHQVKSTRMSNDNAIQFQKQHERIENLDKRQKTQNKSKENFETQKDVSHNNGESVIKPQSIEHNDKDEQNQTQNMRNLAISRQVEVKFNCKEIDESECAQKALMTEKQQPIEGKESDTQMPHLDLDQKPQNQSKSIQHLQSDAVQNQKGNRNSDNNAELQQNNALKGHYRGRSSSLHEQTIFCQAVSHNPHENNHCKCQNKGQQLKTHRKKIEEQRKEKQLIKEKKYQETQRRKELIEKEKQQKLKQLECEIKSKQNSHPPSKRNSHTKIQSTHARSLSKQNMPNKEPPNTVSKDKRAVSNTVEGPKSPLKNISNKKTQEIKNEARITQPMFNQNKPKKSATDTKIPKQKQQILPKKQTTSIDANSKGKSQSKNSLPSKATQLSHQVTKVAQIQNPKIQQKEGKAISSKNQEKPKNLAKKGNSQKNKSYFKSEIDKKPQKAVPRKNQQKQDYENNAQVDQQRMQQGRSKCASIAIQTMEEQDWKKYNSPQKKERTKRNKSVQSKNSSKSMKPAADQIKQHEQKSKKVVKSNYSPIKIDIKDGKTKTIKGKLRQDRQKHMTKSKVSKRSKISKNERNNSQQSYAQSQKSIVDVFDNGSNPQQMISEFNLDKAYIPGLYKSDRQKAMILNQLYNMKEQLSQEAKYYENLYQTNHLYAIAKRQIMTESNNLIMQNLSQNQQVNLSNGDEIVFTQVENTVRESSRSQKLSLFGKDSIQILKLKSNAPHLTRNLHKALHVLAQKNQLLIVRLFQDYKAETNFVYQNQKQTILLQKSTYGVWLCINKTWKLVSVDNTVPAKVLLLEGSSKKHIQPLFGYHEGNQLWLQILQKCLAEALGGYDKLFSLSTGQLFSILTGSNHLLFSINENRSKNKLFLKEITQNDKKNFIMVCEKHSLNLKEQNQKSIESEKIFYLLSKKVVSNGQNDQILLKMKQQILDESVQNPEPYYIRYDKFCEKFKSCEVLHLRQHNYFCSLKLNKLIFSNKAKKSDEGYFSVIEMIFDQMSFGTITVCNQTKSDFRTYLYKLENSDKQIMKLVGQASKLNKKELFFECSFQDQRYYLFIQSSNPNTVVSFMGEGKPEIKIKEQILSNGLKNGMIEYLPVSNYEGHDPKGSVMGRSTSSNFLGPQNESNKKLRNIEDLREMFIELLVEQRRKK